MHIKIQEVDKQKLEAAAKLDHQNLSSFVRRASLLLAESIILNSQATEVKA